MTLSFPMINRTLLVENSRNPINESKKKKERRKDRGREGGRKEDKTVRKI